MYRGHEASLRGSDLGPRDLEEFSLPTPQRHPRPAVPAFHVALARKACTGFALSPAPRGPGSRGAHILSTTVCCPRLPGVGRDAGALHGSSLHALPPAPTWLPTSGCSADALGPFHSSRRTETLWGLPTHRPQAAVCSTEQMKTKRSSLTTREGFQQTTPHTSTSP